MAFKRLMEAFSQTKFGAAFTDKFGKPLDRWIFKSTGGKVMLTRAVSNLNIGMMHLVGHKSGLPRDTPLVFVPHADTPNTFFVAATNFGKPNLPSWYNNLKWMSDVSFTLDGVTYDADVVELDGEAYTDAWQMMRRQVKNYRKYDERVAGQRNIPVFQVTGHTPRPATSEPPTTGDAT
ncbi:MAG: nitroreductase family deazaflavin-dependent oxidoreductase [Chloroflexota bacterium]